MPRLAGVKGVLCKNVIVTLLCAVLPSDIIFPYIIQLLAAENAVHNAPDEVRPDMQQRHIRMRQCCQLLTIVSVRNSMTASVSARQLTLSVCTAPCLAKDGR